MCFSLGTQQIQNCLEVGLKITFRDKKHVGSVFLFLRKSSKEAADQNTEGRRGFRIKGKLILIIIDISDHCTDGQSLTHSWLRAVPAQVQLQEHRGAGKRGRGDQQQHRAWTSVSLI